jgi:hypothetical protein
VKLASEISKVSIPHRFNSHFVRQILISTRFKVAVKIGDAVFQSLTGSIHTEAGAELKLKVLGFQSLTGSIHTIKIAIKNSLTDWVSIPHRFNSHKTEVKL